MAGVRRVLTVPGLGAFAMMTSTRSLPCEPLSISIADFIKRHLRPPVRLAISVRLFNRQFSDNRINVCIFRQFIQLAKCSDESCEQRILFVHWASFSCFHRSFTAFKRQRPSCGRSEWRNATLSWPRCSSPAASKIIAHDQTENEPACAHCTLQRAADL